MTQDRTMALALIEYMMKNGRFTMEEMQKILNDKEVLDKAFSFDSVIEESNKNSLPPQKMEPVQSQNPITTKLPDGETLDGPMPKGLKSTPISDDDNDLPFVILLLVLFMTTKDKAISPILLNISLQFVKSGKG